MRETIKNIIEELELLKDRASSQIKDLDSEIYPQLTIHLASKRTGVIDAIKTIKEQFRR